MWDSSILALITALILCYANHFCEADFNSEEVDDFSSSTTDSELESTTIDYTEPFIGNGWTFSYVHKQNEMVYVSNVTATEEFFNFNIYREQSRRVSIQTSTGAYLVIDASNKSLSLSTINKGLFEIIPTQSETFNLIYNNEPLVAYPSVPPFSFFLQSQYPNEPPSEFQLSQDLDIQRAFAKKRAYIIKIAKYVHESSIMDKSVSYSTLLDIMELYSYVYGKEIFIIGSLMYKDLGLDSIIFQRLPNQVKLLVTGNDVWLHTTYGSWPMKYISSSYYHLYIQPYQFSFDPISYKFAITYANIHVLHFSQICESVDSKPLLQYQVVGGINSNYEFNLYLQSNTSFSISATNTFNRDVCNQMDFAVITQEVDVNEIYFHITPNIFGDTGSQFYVGEY